MFSDDDRPLALRDAPASAAQSVADTPPGEPAFDTLESADVRARAAQRTGRVAIVVTVRPGMDRNRAQVTWNGCHGFVVKRERRNLGTTDKPQVAVVAFHILLDVVDVLEAAREKRERAAMPLATVTAATRRLSPRFKAR